MIFAHAGTLLALAQLWASSATASPVPAINAPGSSAWTLSGLLNKGSSSFPQPVLAAQIPLDGQLAAAFTRSVYSTVLELGVSEA